MCSIGGGGGYGAPAESRKTAPRSAQHTRRTRWTASTCPKPTASTPTTSASCWSCPENHLLWVVVGDIPPAYLRVDADDDPEDALDMYIRMMGAWVDAVEQGKPVDGLIPVNVPPTAEYAEMLGGRLMFLQENFFSDED